MVMGRAWYVQGRKHKFPYGEAWLSGPFEDPALAAAELKSIAPYYPDAALQVSPRTGSSLPQCTPRGPSLRTAKGRIAVADEVVALCERLGVPYRRDDWDGEPTLDIELPTLRAQIWLDWTPSAPMPVVCWIATSPRNLRATLPGAWVGSFPHRKATSVPETWAQFYEALEIGICAGIDGSALEE